MGKNILVRGRPGCGKTTLVVGLVGDLASLGFKAAGFVTEEIREGSRRTGFRVRDLRGGEALFAHVDFRGGPRVGKYGVDLEAFERTALRSLQTAGDEVDLLVIDEIGKMELLSPAFRHLLVDLLEGPLPLLATLHATPHPLTEGISGRADVSVFEMRKNDGERLKEVIKGELLRLLTVKGTTGELEGGVRT